MVSVQSQCPLSRGKSPQEKLNREARQKIMQCLIENVGLWPKNIGKPRENSKQGRDLGEFEFEEDTSGCWVEKGPEGLGETSGEAVITQVMVDWIKQ